MRQKSILTGMGLSVLLLFVLTPLIWQWGYQDRLTRVVRIGSTRDEYRMALQRGRLGDGMIRPAYTFWRPLQFHGFVYTIFAYPEWDLSGHLSGYGLYPKISVRGHAFWLVRKGPDFWDLR